MENIKNVTPEDMADGGRVGMFMGGSLPKGAGLLRQMIKMYAKEKGIENPSTMLSKFNPKRADKFLDDPNIFMKADIKEGIAYQKLNRSTELLIKRRIEDIYNNVNKNNASFEFSPIDAISTIKSKLPDNMKYIVDDWVAIKAKTDSRFVDMYAKKHKK